MTSKAENKDPAFPFYASDVLSDMKVMLMSNQEFGCYMKLLCHCWIEGAIPNDSKKIAKLCGEHSSAMTELWQEMWDTIKECFKTHPDDESLLVSPRLEKERQKRKDFKKERSEAGKLGAESRWGKKKAKNGSANGNNNSSAIGEPSLSHDDASILVMANPVANNNFSFSFSFSDSTTPGEPPPELSTECQDSFSMPIDWYPVAVSFAGTCAIMGANSAFDTPSTRGEFITYWRSQNAEFTQALWEQKYAKSLKRKSDNGQRTAPASQSNHSQGENRVAIARSIDDIQDTSWLT
ncbi:MAG: DUF1376 domain-containing protein [Gammaproteobacteria bacterium]|nr:DUF1376 domain-containing protein [Gammaproteobacteria bacterium]